MFVYIVYFGQSESSAFSVNAVFKERGDAKNRTAGRRKILNCYKIEG